MSNNMMDNTMNNSIHSNDPVFFTDTIIHSKLIKKKSSIWVTFRKEGIHKYPQAATDPKLATGDWLDVSFLGTPHRHIFHFRVEMEVFHDDRDVEFIQAKRIMEKWYADGTLQLDYKSCEMMACDLYDKCAAQWPDRDYTIEVSEDGENGCRINFERVPE